MRRGTEIFMTQEKRSKMGTLRGPVGGVTSDPDFSVRSVRLIGLLLLFVTSAIGLGAVLVEPLRPSVEWG